MAATVAFSRLQLAAALLEYDNDPDNPDAPYRSAQDSAIFAHLRRNPAARPEMSSRKSDYHGTETGTIGGRESVMDTRRSRGSMDALRNPFGMDNHSEVEEEEEEEAGLEVDLASWGLDQFIPKDKEKGGKSSRSKGKQSSASAPIAQRRPSTTFNVAATSPPRKGMVTSSSMSVGGRLEFESHTRYSMEERRHSVGSPLEAASLDPSILHNRRPLSPVGGGGDQTDSIPFPGTTSVIDHKVSMEMETHQRTYSVASMNARSVFEELRGGAAPAPGGGGAESILHQPMSSGASILNKPEDNNPFAIEHTSHTSRFDPKSVARVRSQSNASLGSRMMLENDNMSTLTGDPYARERRYSTMELLRPKVLVMPSPLQPVSSGPPVPEGSHRVREGFEFSSDGPPLPPGARSTRRLSSSMSLLDSNLGSSAPIASNSFTPNPLLDLSASQKIFRNTLVVGGRNDSYAETGKLLPRALEDGEQAQLYPVEQDEIPQAPVVEEPHVKGSRPAGKLYGKSLIDDLENRKHQMRSKQRVFTGDQRPSMMAREGQQRASTLIDPSSLATKPATQKMSTLGPQPLARKSSLNVKPLLNFDDGPNPAGVSAALPSGARPALAHNTRSVFGVDTLWEREMVKLKEIQAQEEKEKMEREEREKEEERKRMEKEKRKKKKRGKGVEEGEQQQGQEEFYTPPQESEPVLESRVSIDPPILPNIERATRRAPPRQAASDDSSGSDDSDDDDDVVPQAAAAPVWHSSDEDEAAPTRTTGVGPRYKSIKRRHQQQLDADSEEDLPLSATLHKVVARAGQSRYGGDNDSEDEDKPLSHVLLAKSTPSLQSNLNMLSLKPTHDSDEDDQPLALRASRAFPGNNNNNNNHDEDDVPLALHPEQQRKSQFNMFAQHHHQQQQQQQMFMQMQQMQQIQQMQQMQQMQSTMMMNTPMMSPGGYFVPQPMNPMGMMPMIPPMPIPSPPPMHDEAKFGAVDRWRRDVVIDGSEKAT